MTLLIGAIIVLSIVIMSEGMLKPVYLRNRDLDNDQKKYVTDYELLESVTKCITDTKCIQKDRDLWRIYVGSNESRNKLLNEGNTTAQGFETNPFSAGTSSPTEEVLKITVKGVPLSVGDNEIIKMLDKFKIERTSPLKYEKIRHPVTRKMTGIMNGNRFLYAKPLSEGRFLPRTSSCAGLKCQIFHYGQPSYKRKPVCTNCWREDHFRLQCSNAKRCKVCLSEDNVPGSELCSGYIKEHTNVVSFNGNDNALSNFFPCEFEAFGIKHRSSEHAFQYVKALRCVDLPRATDIQAAQTALDAKNIGKQIRTSEQFEEKKIEIMEEIIEEKMKQVKPFSERLSKFAKGTIFAESTYDDFWGTGLDKNGTDHTQEGKWPGKNHLGLIIQKVAGVRKCHQRSWSCPKNASKSQEKQVDITTMLKNVRDRDSRKRARDKRNSHDQSSRENSPRKRSKNSRRHTHNRRQRRTSDFDSRASTDED